MARILILLGLLSVGCGKETDSKESKAQGSVAVNGQKTAELELFGPGHIVRGGNDYWKKTGRVRGPIGNALVRLGLKIGYDQDVGFNPYHYPMPRTPYGYYPPVWQPLSPMMFHWPQPLVAPRAAPLMPRAPVRQDASTQTEVVPGIERGTQTEPHPGGPRRMLAPDLAPSYGSGGAIGVRYSGASGSPPPVGPVRIDGPQVPAAPLVAAPLAAAPPSSIGEAGGRLGGGLPAHRAMVQQVPYGPSTMRLPAVSPVYLASPRFLGLPAATYPVGY